VRWEYDGVIFVALEETEIGLRVVWLRVLQNLGDLRFLASICEWGVDFDFINVL
jgi:hypothetical protein